MFEPYCFNNRFYSKIPGGKKNPYRGRTYNKTLPRWPQLFLKGRFYLGFGGFVLSYLYLLFGLLVVFQKKSSFTWFCFFQLLYFIFTLTRFYPDFTGQKLVKMVWVGFSWRVGGVLCSGTVRFCFGKRETQKLGARHLQPKHFFQNYSFLIGQGFKFESVIFHSTPTYYKSHPGLSGSPEPSDGPDVQKVW